MKIFGYDEMWSLERPETGASDGHRPRSNLEHLVKPMQTKCNIVCPELPLPFPLYMDTVCSNVG